MKLFSGLQRQLPTELCFGDVWYSNDTQRVYVGSTTNVPVELTDGYVLIPTPNGTFPVAGPPGPTGAQGATVVGPQGPQGVQGEQGIAGCAGDDPEPSVWEVCRS